MPPSKKVRKQLIALDNLQESSVLHLIVLGQLLILYRFYLIKKSQFQIDQQKKDNRREHQIARWNVTRSKKKFTMLTENNKQVCVPIDSAFFM